MTERIVMGVDFGRADDDVTVCMAGTGPDGTMRVLGFFTWRSPRSRRAVGVLQRRSRATGLWVELCDVEVTMATKVLLLGGPADGQMRVFEGGVLSLPEMVEASSDEVEPASEMATTLPRPRRAAYFLRWYRERDGRQFPVYVVDGYSGPPPAEM